MKLLKTFIFLNILFFGSAIYINNNPSELEDAEIMQVLEILYGVPLQSVTVTLTPEEITEQPEVIPTTSESFLEGTTTIPETTTTNNNYEKSYDAIPVVRLRRSVESRKTNDDSMMKNKESMKKVINLLIYLCIFNIFFWSRINWFYFFIFQSKHLPYPYKAIIIKRRSLKNLLDKTATNIKTTLPTPKSPIDFALPHFNDDDDDIDEDDTDYFSGVKTIETNEVFMELSAFVKYAKNLNLPLESTIYVADVSRQYWYVYTAKDGKIVAIDMGYEDFW